MSASWKQYGGAKSLETNRKITTNTIVTDEIVLKNSYIGGFTINGVLDVTGKAILQGGLDVSGLITSSNILTHTINVTNNSYLNSSVFVGGDIYSNRDIYNGNTITIGNNLFVKNNAEIDEYIYFEPSHNIFLHGSNIGLGINTENATASLEISSNIIKSLNIYSSQPINRNNIAQNNLKKGVMVIADISSSYINFFNDSSINDTTYDASIGYKSGGIFEIDVSTNTQIMSTLSVTNRHNPAHILNEAVIIYDISSGKYKQDIYNNSNTNTGNALTVVTNDNSSNTFINMITPNKMGFGIAGGLYPYDTTRSMGLIGLFDSCNNYLQNQTIISGIDPVKYKTTTGFNTYIPKTEKYILDVNGPIHIDNGDITIAKITNFQIIKMAISPVGNLLLAIGYPSYITDPSYGASKLVISTDYGATWRENNFIQSDNSPLFSGKNNIGISTSYVINDAFIYDNSYVFLVCSDNTNTTPYLLWSNTGGKYWYNATIQYSGTGFNINFSYNFIKILIKDGINISNNYVNLFIISSDNTIYTVNLIINGSNINTYSQINKYNLTGLIINSLTYYQNTSFFATNDGIYSINNDNLFRISNSVVNYSEIKYLNNIIITVGNSIITKSTDGIIFSDISFQNINFTSLTLYNNFAFTIGNQNTIWFSNDTGNTWNPLWKLTSYDNISQSGKQFILTNPANIFSNILISDENSIVISRTDISYSSINNSKSSIINCFLPNLLNRANNNVLDICGNMCIMGDIHIDDNGKIVSNNSQFSLINDNVNQVYFAGNANTIIIGNTTIGNTVIRNNLNVKLNTSISGNVSIYGQEIIYNTTDSSGISSGAVIINGGAGISKTVNIGGNLSVNQNSVFTGTVDVVLDTSLNGNLYVNSDTPSINTTTGAVIIKGGMGIDGNIHIGNNTSVLGNIFMPILTSTAYLNTVNITGNHSNALYVNGSSILNSNLSIYGQELIYNTTDSSGISSGAVIINGGAGISKTVNIGGNLLVNQNSVFTGTIGVLSDTSLNGLVYINSGSPSVNTTTGAVIIKGGIGIDGNIHIGSNLFVRQNSLFTGLVGINSDMSLNGNLYINSSTVSSNTTTGAVVITGGVGVGGNINIRQNSTVNGNIIMIGNTSIANLNNILVTGEEDSTTFNSGALQVNGGIGVTKNMNIGGNLTVNKNSLLYGNLNINNNAIIQGNAIVYNGFISQSDITSFGNIRINNNTNSTGFNSGALIIEGGVGIGGNVNIASNIIVTQNITSSTSSSSILNTNSIRTNNSNNKILSIGDNDDLNTTLINIGSGFGKQLNIGESTGTINIGSITTGSSSSIFIGGNNDRTIFSGNVIFPAGTSSYTTIIQKTNYLVLNTDQSGADIITINQNYGGDDSTIGGGGLWFNDFSNQTMGQIVVTGDLKAFKLKAPFYSRSTDYESDIANNLVSRNQNSIRFDISKLTTTSMNGLVIISPLATGNQDECNYTITGTSLDISSILIKTQDTDPNIQTIQTNISIEKSLSVRGNTIIGGNLNISGNLKAISNANFNNININTETPVSNSSLTIAGNAIISKLGIGTSSVNTNANSLEVQGNFYQLNGGFIYQF